MLDLLKPKILIFIIVAVLTSVALTVYIMKNVYKPKAFYSCASNLKNISYNTPCTAYYYANYTCKNGVKGRVGDGTCQLYTTLYQQAKDACCNSPGPAPTGGPTIGPTSISRLTPTPTPPAPTSFTPSITPTPTICAGLNKSCSNAKPCCAGLSCRGGRCR